MGFINSTLVNISSGLSINVKDMLNIDQNVLSWDKKSDQLLYSKQIDFVHKGEKKCVELTFEDGTKTICSRNSLLLTSVGKWVKAKDLNVGKDRIKSGACNPEFKCEEITECNSWKLEMNNHMFKTHTIDNLLKTLALSRLIGMILSDGTIVKYMCRISIGHMIDANSIIEDIFLLTNKTPKICKTIDMWVINVPQPLSRDIANLPGIATGNRVKQNTTFPEFILDKKCPKPIIREFLGGLFGGDGHCPVLTTHGRRESRDQITSVCFSQTKCKSHLDSLHEYMNNIISLFERLGFDKTALSLQKPKETTLSKTKALLEKDLLEEEKNEKHYQITLQINVNHLLMFAEKVGFRYCIHKSQRLAAAVSYRKLRENTCRQTRYVIDRVRELSGYERNKRTNIKKTTGKTIKEWVEYVHEELKSREPIYNEYYSLPHYELVRERLKRPAYNDENFNKMKYDNFPTAEEYLRSIGALNFFVDKEESTIIFYDEDGNEEEDNTIIFCDEDGNKEIEKKKVCYSVKRTDIGVPVFNLKIIGRKNVGLKNVYDIKVKNTKNHLANGIVVC